MTHRPTPIPGFVDLQVNGFLGVDFSSPTLTADQAADACRALLRRGTAAFLPTVITSPPHVYRRNLPLLAALTRRPEFQGRLLGLHIEGPFISPAPGAVGAHDLAYVRPPDVDLLRQMLDWADGAVRLLTIAAELPGAADLTRYAVRRGVVVSVGHTLATAADLDLVAQAGATALTHLGNGIPNLLPRHDNPIWCGLAHDGLTVMMIADGHHLPPSVLKTFVRAKGVDRCVVVSDASPIAGLPPGRYTTLGNDVILEPSGRLHNPTKGVLVGSSATMLACMNHLAGLGWLSLDDLLALGYTNPLRLIGADPASVPNDTRLVWDEEGRAFGTPSSSE